MNRFHRPTRTAAARLVLAAVVSFAMLTACRPRPQTPATGSATAQTIPDQANDGHFTLTVKVDPDQPGKITVVVTSTDDAFEEIDAETANGLIEVRAETAVLGSLDRVSDRELHFSPSFPLLAGSEVLVRFDPTQDQTLNGSPLELRHRVPSPPAAPAPTIEHIYPTADLLPANHLKFYIVFSEPMQPGEIWNYFGLLDLDNEQPVPRPFRHTELWSRDGKILTLWFHPGRVKTGVNLNTELGAILVSGRRYRLSVSGDWPSARGTPLGKDVSREFRAGPHDHTQPDPADWKLKIPAPGSREPLVCQLGSPHDWALLHSDVAVENAAEKPLAGSISTSHHQSHWHFTPNEPWQAGRYRLAIGSVLEDLAGNNLERPFEVDLSRKSNRDADAKPNTASAYRKFDVGP